MYYYVLSCSVYWERSSLQCAQGITQYLSWGFPDNGPDTGVSTVYTVPLVQCTLYSVPCTVPLVQCTLYSVPCTVYLVQ